MTAAANILILSSNTGGGHLSAAKALEDSFIRLSAGRALVSIAQVLEEASTLSRLMADFYNWILRNRQPWMRHYFNWIEQVHLHEQPIVFRAAYGYAQSLFDRVCPDVLVSVHPMMQHFFAYVSEKLGLNIPLVTVVTDPAPGFWSAWACPQVSRYYVASLPAKEQLTRYGVESHKIHVTGMPVRSGFKPVPDKGFHREQLGLRPDAFTVLMSAGYIGGGNAPLMLDSLRHSGFEGQVIFLTGRNKRLYEETAALSEQSTLPMRIVPLSYVPDIAPWLQASDVVVTKMGGLTTFEALACEVPVLADCITPPMPQEAQTVDMLTRMGAAIPIYDTQGLQQSLMALQQDDLKRQMMRVQGRQLVLPGAADHIAQDVMSLVSPGSRIILPGAVAVN